MKRVKLIALVGAIVAVLAASLLIVLAYHDGRLLPSPEPSREQPYDYYLIIDRADGTVLMYVSIEVHVGDEVLTAENKLFRVVRLRQNVAEAKFIGFRFMQE